jgi:hypothetical protein
VIIITIFLLLLPSKQAMLPFIIHHGGGEGRVGGMVESD